MESRAPASLRLTGQRWGRGSHFGQVPAEATRRPFVKERVKREERCTDRERAAPQVPVVAEPGPAHFRLTETSLFLVVT